MSCKNAFGKTICSICYEDLKPLIEDLQSISICGHQWIEYCPKTKSTCPFCKQRCCQENIARLYFQSVGDQNETQRSQKPLNGVGDEDGDDPVELRLEVKRLEGKLSGITSVFKRQEEDLKELDEELRRCKENAKTQEKLKNEALKEKASMQLKLQTKSEDLEKVFSESSKLHDRNMALAKELAALKLVSDVNLEEEEVVKLASFGNGPNNKDTVDILKKSLVLRNKSYKELMVQCNLLGRGEAHATKKLEKTKEKMKKMKTRMQELELALEENENKALRSLKHSKNIPSDMVNLNDIKEQSKASYINRYLSEDQIAQSLKPVKYSNQNVGFSSRLQLPRTLNTESNQSDDIKEQSETQDINNHQSEDRMAQSLKPARNPNQSDGFSSRSQIPRTLNTDSHKEFKDTNIIDIDEEDDFDIFTDKNEPESHPYEHGVSSHILNPSSNVGLKTKEFNKDIYLQKSSMLKPKIASDASKEPVMPRKISWAGLSGPCSGTKKDANYSSVGAMEENALNINSRRSDAETLILDEMLEDPALLHITKETSYDAPISRPGDRCFAGGFLAPDGANRHLGKWCKRAQTDTSVSSANDGDLIAVGADGRGGRIKVLRTQNHLDVKGSSLLAKKCKVGAKQNDPLPRGCLQIEHFFGKANRS
ncbi:hypothetical protein GIB67_037172 [Kingdonia uniflora]|uniref:RING-type domain-containing protein n=1 Tax=Kingdonia uniflora TaxID=39325 RepID=A0A7J7MRM9_9MAGN|nr:hypothetical protein GIB67_037172 [Kingdonia uniflora]